MVIYFRTDGIDGLPVGKVKPKQQCWDSGIVAIPQNATHGIPGRLNKQMAFNSLGELTFTIEQTLLVLTASQSGPTKPRPNCLGRNQREAVRLRLDGFLTKAARSTATSQAPQLAHGGGFRCPAGINTATDHRQTGSGLLPPGSQKRGRRLHLTTSERSKQAVWLNQGSDPTQR